MNGGEKAMLDKYSSGIRCFYSSASMQSQTVIVLILVIHLGFMYRCMVMQIAKICISSG